MFSCFLKELLGTDVFGRELGSEGGPELARSLQAKSILCNNFKLGCAKTVKMMRMS